MVDLQVVSPNALSGDSLGVAGELIREGHVWCRVVAAVDVVVVENGILIASTRWGLWRLADDWGDDLVDNWGSWSWSWLFDNNWCWGGGWFDLGWRWLLNLGGLDWPMAATKTFSTSVNALESYI